ncbi:hypothetical protein ElyMa_003351300 [Elysia marginata]|uniref:Uncharacterized protein n=1 Tax=Elysia marginata TaxID=1093978 RepID=A0AAV4JKC1_9GAST|nr:hypothetical protein ElyMa_003351300 [Elysia marginata]
MGKNFPTVALQPLLCKVCRMRGRIIVLKLNTPSQECRSFATNCISEAVKSAAALSSIDTLTFRIPEHGSHHFSCGPLHFQLFGHGRGWMFPI